MFFQHQKKSRFVCTILSFILYFSIKVHFKVRFDAKDFLPEDIEVTTVDNHLRVHAKKSIKSGNSTTVREFHRSVDLPRSIDHENFQCHMTEVRLILSLIFIVKYN